MKRTSEEASDVEQQGERPLSIAGAPRLELEKTRLRVIRNELVRFNDNDYAVTRLKLSDIHDIHCRHERDPVGIFFIAAGLGLAAVAFWVAESNIADTVLYVLAVLAAAFGLLGSANSKIVIDSAAGVFKVQSADMEDETEGFVVSVRQLLSEGRSR